MKRLASGALLAVVLAAGFAYSASPVPPAEDVRPISGDRLYLLMRTDVPELNPGRAVAQGAHAATKFLLETQNDPRWRGRVADWAGDRGFGTKISLDAKDEPTVSALVAKAKELGFPAGLVVDPTYPLKGGSAAMLTCGYIFGDVRALRPLLGRLPLLK